MAYPETKQIVDMKQLGVDHFFIEPMRTTIPKTRALTERIDDVGNVVVANLSEQPVHVSVETSSGVLYLCIHANK